MLAKRDKDNVHPDSVAGVPDSGIAHAVGYANESGIPFYPSFYQIYTDLAQILYADRCRASRDLIAKMKLIPVDGLIRDKKPAAHRRLHCPRYPAAGNHRVPVSQRMQKKYISVRPARRWSMAANF